MNYTQSLQKWGNGKGVRLPQKVVQAAKWQPSQVVTVNINGTSITLTPVKPTRNKSLTLAALLEGVTPEKVGGEWDWGPDRGNEVTRDK